MLMQVPSKRPRARPEDDSFASGFDHVYVVKGVTPDVPLEDIFRGVVPFLIMEFITLTILIAFPQIILWLPGTMN